MAQQTEEMPAIVGDYKEYFRIFKDADSKAYHNEIVQLVKKLFQIRDSHKRRLLDIGCGRANLVDRICNYFKAVTLVEPNPFFVQMWESRGWFNNANWKIHSCPTTIENLLANKGEIVNHLKPNSVDCIIMCHSIYHFDLDQLNTLLTRLYSYLTEDGVIIITAGSDKDALVSDVYKKLAPTYSLTERLEKALVDNKMLFGILDQSLTTVVNAETQQTMETMLAWVTIQNCLNSNFVDAKRLSDNKLEIKAKDLCAEFINKLISNAADGASVTLELRHCHFVISKNQKIVDYALSVNKPKPVMNGSGGDENKNNTEHNNDSASGGVGNNLRQLSASDRSGAEYVYSRSISAGGGNEASAVAPSVDENTNVSDLPPMPENSDL